MNTKSQFTLQVFEKIGTPLFASVNEVAARGIMTGQVKDMPSDIEIAETVAKLLTSLTQSGTKLSEKIGLTNTDPDSDDLQIAMAGILSPIIANLYQVSGHPPKEPDLDRVLSSFDTVASFSENFTSTKEGAETLNNLSSNTQQNKTLRYTMAMVPLVNSVAAFSFGEDPDKLLKKISERLTKTAKEIAETITEKPVDEIAILNGLVTIYSQCHFSEMARIMSMTDEQRQGNTVTVDSVWSMVDQRIDMLKILVEAISNPTAIATPEKTAPKAEVQPQAPETKTEPKDEPQKANGGIGGGPMSFFKNKEEDDASTATGDA